MGLFDNIKILSGNKPNSNDTPPPTSDSRKIILVVEDEKLLSDALSKKLTAAGFHVLTAENGEIGLETIVSQKPDLVLLDLMMPIMDGKTMLRKLRDFPQFKSLPVIVLTNAGDVDSMMETKTYYNALEFFIKSNISLDQIIQKIKSVLG